MFQVWFDLFRVVFAIGALYVVLPVLSARFGDKWRGPWYALIVPSVIRTLLVMEFACILLGSWKLCLPGIVLSIYFLWMGTNIALASHKRWIYDAAAWQKAYAGLWRWWDNRAGAAKVLERVVHISQTGLLLGLILISASVQFLWYPLTNFRFLGIQTYARVVSLQTLVTGNLWNADGSVAFLAPVVFLSGLDAATVIRLSAPVFYALLMGTVAWCAYQYSQALWCSTFAAGLFWIYTRNFGLDSAGEPAGLEISAFFLVLATGCLRRAPGYAVCAALLAWIVEPSFPGIFLASLGCVLAALMVYWCYARSPRLVRQAVASVFLVAMGMSLNSAFSSTPADGPYEYESSARMAAQIARKFPRNRWVLVSPIHEASYSYGRGWHVELTDFLSTYSEARVSNPKFQFPYEAENIFVFIEKRPLPQLGKLALPGSAGRSFFYSTSTGRASMEFDAARLMAAYASAHKDSSVYYEDGDLMIYRIAK